VCRSSCGCLESLSRTKFALIIPSRAIDTSKVPGKVVLDTLEAISEFKRAVAVESISAGLARARRRGVRLGRPEKVAAYRKDVLRLKARGLTGRAIAKEIGVPSANVFRIIRAKALGNVFWPTRPKIVGLPNCLRPSLGVFMDATVLQL
jgi:DNA invertase Pin-like site-specific DNA recombinase